MSKGLKIFLGVVLFFIVGKSINSCIADDQLDHTYIENIDIRSYCTSDEDSDIEDSDIYIIRIEIEYPRDEMLLTLSSDDNTDIQWKIEPGIDPMITYNFTLKPQSKGKFILESIGDESTYRYEEEFDIAWCSGS